jgi:hypothetical protein
MTLPYRRDKDIKNSSVIAGLRMEPKLAQALTEWARAHARDEDNRANVVRAVRYLLGEACGFDAERHHGTQSFMIAAGLRGSKAFSEAVTAYCKRMEMPPASAIRHALRTQLGWDAEDSLETEQGFAEIAEHKRNLHGGSDS